MSAGAGLLELLERLESGRTHDLRSAAWWQLSAAGALIQCCQSACREVDDRTLDAVWPRVLRESPAGLFGFYRDEEAFRSAPADDPVDIARIWRQVRGLVAAARAAKAAAFEETALRQRVEECAAAYGDSVPGRTDNARPSPPAISVPDAVTRLDAHFHQLEGHVERAVLAQAWTAARWFLAGVSGGPHRRHGRTLRMPLLWADPSQGRVCWLEVERLPSGSGALFADPVGMPFLPVLASFQKSISTAFDAARTTSGLAADELDDVDILWRVSGSSVPYLCGGSAGAAIAVALVQLLKELPLDQRSTITATIDAAGILGLVRGVEQKTQAAVRELVAQGTMLEMIVVHPDNHGEISRGVLAAGLDAARVVAVARTLPEALAAATDLPNRMVGYLQALIDAPDQEPRPAWFGVRQITQLYIEPDLLRREDSRDKERGPDKPPDQRKDRDSLSTAVRDHDELAQFGERWSNNPEKRVSWRSLWESKCGGGSPWRCAIIGPPGQGKSLTAAITARQLSELARSQLVDEQKPFDQIPLPVLLPLPLLIEHLAAAPQRGDSPEDQVRRAIASTLKAQGHSPEVAAELTQHVHRARAWLLLDALDEVEGHDKLLAALFKVFETWNCQLVVFSRPYGLRSLVLPFTIDEYRLAPLSSRQVRQFTRVWALDNAELAGVIERGPRLAELGENPYLLTAICEIAQNEPLAEFVTRGELYRKILDLTLEGPDRAGAWLDCLGEVAWHMVRSEAARPQLDGEALLQLLQKSPNAPLDEEGMARPGTRACAMLLRDELVRKRLLAYTAGKHGLVFVHRSLAEFLCGLYLARAVDETDWESAEVRLADRRRCRVKRLLSRKAWDATWEQIVLFTAGQLINPGPLFRELLDHEGTEDNPAGDDIFRHRLLLGCSCFEELNTTRVKEHLILAYVTHLVMRRLRQNAFGMSVMEEKHYRALRSLASADRRVAGQIGLLKDLLAGLHGESKRQASDTISRLGRIAATGDIIARLREMLSEPDEEVRTLATESLRELADALPIPDALAILEHHFSFGYIDFSDHQPRMYAIEKIGEGALLEEFGECLFDRIAGSPPANCQWTETHETLRRGLARQDERIIHGIVTAVLRGKKIENVTRPWLLQLLHCVLENRIALKIVGGSSFRYIGKWAATTSVFDYLVTQLKAGDTQSSMYAISVLASFDEYGAMPAVIKTIPALLTSESMDLREQTCFAVYRFRERAFDPEIVNGLVNLVQRGEEWASRALGRLGREAARSDVLELLADRVREGQPSSGGPLGMLAVKAGPEIVGQIIRQMRLHLNGDSPLVIKEAAEALVEIGAEAATSDVFNELIAAWDRVLPDRDELRPMSHQPRKLTQRDVACFIAELTRVSHNPDQLIPWLITRLERDEWQVKSYCADTLVAVGDRVVALGHLARLLALRRDRVTWRFVSTLLGHLGNNAAVAEVFARLFQTWHPTRWDRSTGTAVQRLMADRVRIFSSPEHDGQTSGLISELAVLDVDADVLAVVDPSRLTLRQVTELTSLD